MNIQPDAKSTDAADKQSYAPAKIVKGLNWGNELPNQMIILGGKLILKDSGKTPTFDLPDGTEVNIVPHDACKRIMDDSMLLRNLQQAS